MVKDRVFQRSQGHGNKDISKPSGGLQERRKIEPEIEDWVKSTNDGIPRVELRHGGTLKSFSGNIQTRDPQIFSVKG